MEIKEYNYKKTWENLNSDNTKQIRSILKGCNLKVIGYTTKSIREHILESLRKEGWSGRVNIGNSSKINITSTKGKYGLCLQTGNMSRFYADLLKLEFIFQKKKIEGAYYLIPQYELAVKLGSNIAHFERFTNELEMFDVVISIPILVIGFR